MKHFVKIITYYSTSTVLHLLQKTPLFMWINQCRSWQQTVCLRKNTVLM